MFGGKRTAKSNDWIFSTGLRVIYRHRRCQFGLTLRGRSDRRALRQVERTSLRSASRLSNSTEIRTQSSNRAPAMAAFLNEHYQE